MTTGLARVQEYQRHTTGSEHFHALTFYPRLICTDGVKLMADELRAYWLVDAVASHLMTSQELRREGFQVWKLELVPPNGAVLTAHDGDKGEGPRELVRQQIEYTDFPATFTLWCEQSGERFVLMLPEER